MFTYCMVHDSVDAAGWALDKIKNVLGTGKIHPSEAHILAAQLRNVYEIIRTGRNFTSIRTSIQAVHEQTLGYKGQKLASSALATWEAYHKEIIHKLDTYEHADSDSQSSRRRTILLARIEAMISQIEKHERTVEGITRGGSHLAGQHRRSDILGRR